MYSCSYILIRDEENPRLSSLWSDLLSSWHKHGNRGDGGVKDTSTSYPDLFVLGGLQTMDNAVISPGMTLPSLLNYLFLVHVIFHRIFFATLFRYTRREIGDPEAFSRCEATSSYTRPF